MNKEQIEERIKNLTAEKEQLKTTFTSNYNAYEGALQDCNYWLAQIAEQEVPKQEQVVD